MEGVFTLNRLDYFKSFSTFFEESKPSFIVENERFGGVNAILPVSYVGKLSAGYAFGGIENRYYQTDEFTPSDTTDLTEVSGHTINLEYTQSNLNRKQYASEGSLVNVNLSYFTGTENTTPGSTSQLLFPATDKPQEFFNASLKTQKYFTFNNLLHVGISLEANAMYTEDFLDNFTASVIASPSFQPTPESRAMFIQDYATHFWVAPGLQTIFSVTSNIDIRAEGYIFQPFLPLDKNRYNQPFYGSQNNDKPLGSLSLIGSASAIYHSPIGPLSASFNYYEAREKPFSFLVSFGYIIHNRRFLK